MAWQMDDENNVPASSSNNIPKVAASKGAESRVQDKIGSNKEDTDDSVLDAPVYKPIDLSKAGLHKSTRSAKPVQQMNLMTTLGFITTLCLSGATSTMSTAHSVVYNTIAYQD